MKTASQLAILVLATFNLSAGTLYVSLESTNPVAPYATWATAATNIQHAVDVSKAGDTVLVTNGVYVPVAITNSIRLESVYGPLVTTINAGGQGGCVYLGDNSVLSGFTLTNGYEYKGGGVFAEPSGIVTNCIVSGNGTRVIWGHVGQGGGAYGGTLYNCTLTGNSALLDGYPTPLAPGRGGAVYGATLYNCTLTDNHADYDGGAASGSTLYNCTLTRNSGGGAYGSTLYNCTVSGNQGSWGGGASGSTLYNCIVTGNSGDYGGGGCGKHAL